jgi:signal transduction histidine kinase
MDDMAWLGWILALVFGILSVVLLARRSAAGSPGTSGSSSPTLISIPTPGVVPPSSPSPGGGISGPRSELPQAAHQDVALRGTLDYLRRTVLPELQELRALLPGAAGPAEELLERALDALEDLTFYADPPPEEVMVVENLADVVQEAVRQYTIETRVPVRVHPPATEIRVPLRREALKDAVFLLLANAGQYSEGRPIDVFLEAEPSGGYRIRIVDAGPGFTEEALDRALEPFWSTDPRGLGLGLPQARGRVAEMKGHLSLRNQEAGGAEVILDFPRGDEGPAA